MKPTCFLITMQDPTCFLIMHPWILETRVLNSVFQTAFFFFWQESVISSLMPLNKAGRGCGRTNAFARVSYEKNRARTDVHAKTDLARTLRM
jgi:hypothetical protein